MAESILVTGTRASNTVKVSTSMLRVKKSMVNGNMANVLDGLKIEINKYLMFYLIIYNYFVKLLFKEFLNI